MPFTLRIRFSGLCLFAPQPAAGGTPDRMHVLMPKATGAHLHIPVLEFDAAHMLPGSTPGSAVTQLLLRESALTVEGAGVDLKVCDEIVNVRDATSSPVLPDLYDGNPGGLLASRVTLLGGRMKRVSPGVCWKWVDGKRRRMAHVAEWEMSMPGDALLWVLQQLPGGTTTPPAVPLLIPMGPSGGKLLNVRIRHLPADELTLERPDKPIPTKADHFAHYYALFGKPVTVLPTDPVDDPTCPPEQDCPHIVNSGESAYNCMLGTG